VIERLRTWILKLPLAEYLSLHLLVGLAVSVLGLWIFSHLAEDVVQNEPLVKFDITLANVLHAGATAQSTTFFLVVTAFGGQIIQILTVLLSLFFIWRRQWLFLVIWLAALIGGQVLNCLLKTWFARPRPSFTDPIAVASYYSFPSGHAMMSFIAYGMLAYFLLLYIKNLRLRILLIFATVLLVVLVGISRLYLGVHYFSDVVGGFAAGAIWLSTCATAMDIIQRRRQRVAPPSG